MLINHVGIVYIVNEKVADQFLLVAKAYYFFFWFYAKESD